MHTRNIFSNDINIRGKIEFLELFIDLSIVLHTSNYLIYIPFHELLDEAVDRNIVLMSDIIRS